MGTIPTSRRRVSREARAARANNTHAAGDSPVLSARRPPQSPRQRKELSRAQPCRPLAAGRALRPGSSRVCQECGYDVSIHPT